MGQRTQQEQVGMWVTVSELPRSVSHPFYEKLNRLLAEHGFDDFRGAVPAVLCREDGRLSLAPGTILPSFLTWLFRGAGLGARHSWRAADSLGVRGFLGLALTEAAPDHSTISRTRRLIDLDTHRAVFTWVVQCLGIAGLVKGKTLAGRNNRALTDSLNSPIEFQTPYQVMNIASLGLTVILDGGTIILIRFALRTVCPASTLRSFTPG